MKLFFSTFLIFLFLQVGLHFAMHNEMGKKHKKKLKEVVKDYAMLEKETAKESFKGVGYNFPNYLQLNERTGNILGSLNLSTVNTANANNNISNSQFKTFGIEVENKKKEVTYRRPIYVGDDGSANNSDNNSRPALKLDEEVESKFLETSAGESVKQKEIVFNSNQVEIQPGHYRKAIVKGEENKKGKEVLTVVGKEDSNSNSKNKTINKQDKEEIEKKVSENVIKNKQEKIVRKKEPKISNNNTPNTHYTEEKLFDNEREINEVSTKVADLVKNILVDVIEQKTRGGDIDVENIITNRSRDVQKLIKNSLFKLHKKKSTAVDNKIFPERELIKLHENKEQKALEVSKIKTEKLKLITKRNEDKLIKTEVEKLTKHAENVIPNLTVINDTHVVNNNSTVYDHNSILTNNASHRQGEKIKEKEKEKIVLPVITNTTIGINETNKNIEIHLNHLNNTEIIIKNNSNLVNNSEIQKNSTVQSEYVTRMEVNKSVNLNNTHKMKLPKIPKIYHTTSHNANQTMYLPTIDKVENKETKKVEVNTQENYHSNHQNHANHANYTKPMKVDEDVDESSIISEILSNFKDKPKHVDSN